MPPNYPVDMRLDINVPMRDGVELSADIYLPRASGPFPTVLMRTPYDNNTEGNIEKGRRLANQGYACVIQDVRGRWDSGGEYYPFREGEDGHDTQEWIGGQDWSNGKVGMAGGSYVGLVQWQSAPHRSRFLTCMAPRVICCDFYSGLVYPGGAFQLNVLMTWGMRTNGRTAQSIEYHNWTEAFRDLPIARMDEQAGRGLEFWKDWVNHPTYDDYWDAINVETQWGEIAAPAYNMGGWYDLYAQHTFINFNGLHLNGRTPEAKQSKLIVGPWPHGLSASAKTGDIDYGAPSMQDLESMELRWFDHWLKGEDNGITDEPPLQLYIMGINRWRDEHEWPLARTQWQKWHLHSGGSANTLRGHGALSPEPPGDETADTYEYDPLFPVQTRGGNNCCSPHIVPWGPYDQRAVEMRADVLCYTSAPLVQGLEVTGPIKVVLYAETDGSDTDWTAKLVDVSPSGYAKNLCDGIIRARYRESLSDPTLLEANKIYEYEIDVGVTGNVFLKGHGIRLEISSSNFPRFDRNPNTGHAFGQDTELRVARQTVHHSAKYPSHVVLPVIPAG
ncbi:MAG: CocE/NonD family hydrolase [Candidatus Latescibacteria bacterium]|nr:CocE/NonD family hydrolase [Candidatus Latescibacterota bacterium]